MKTLLRVVVALIAMAFGVGFGQTHPDRKAPEIPSDLLATLRQDLKGIEYYEDCMDPDSDHPPVATPLDLGQPRPPAFDVAPCPGGQGSAGFLYVRSGRGWRQVLATGEGEGLVVCGRAGAEPCPLPKGAHSSVGAHGWPDLELWVHVSAYEATQVVYRFDGKVYKAVACRELEDKKPRPCLPDYRASDIVKSVQVPSSLLATLHSDTDDLRTGCQKSPSEEDFFRARWFDLDRLQPALLAQARCWAGPDKLLSKLLLYVRTGQGWRKIFEGLGNTLLACAEVDPPCPVPSRSERGSGDALGWPDLSVLDARRTRLIVYRFDGNAYKAVSCYDVKYSNPQGERYSELRYDSCPANWRSAKQESSDVAPYLSQRRLPPGYSP